MENHRDHTPNAGKPAANEVVSGNESCGTLAEAQFWLSEYPQRYVSSVDESKAGLYFKTSWNLVWQGYLGYFWLSAFGFLALWLSRIPLASKVFLTLWTVLSVLTVLPGMRFYGHYWLLSFLLTFVQPPDYDPYMFIEVDSKSKPAVVKLKVQEGAVKNNVAFIQVYKRRD